MQKYIIRRVTQTTERKEIKAINWEDAVKQLNSFVGEIILDDCLIIYDLCTVEYIGDTGASLD